MHRLGRLPLLTKVCLFSFTFTFVLALTSVCVQTFLNISQQKTNIKECINDSVNPQLNKISEYVWKEQFLALNTFFKAFNTTCQDSGALDLANLPILFSIVDKNSHRFEFGSLTASKNTITSTYPLSYWQENTEASAYWLGELTVSISFNDTLNGLLNEAYSQILRHFLVSLAGTLLGFLLGYKMIIERIRSFTNQLRTDTSYEDIKAYVDEDTTELSSLWSSIVNFKESLDSKRLGIDIQLKQCQAELVKVQKESELKSQFLAKMSHELRTPMNGLLGFSTLLLESKLEDEQREYAQTIQASLESLLYVVNDVLDLSRIESGDLNITSIPFSLRSVISGVTALLKNRADAKGLELDTRIGSDVPDNLKGDPVRIRQVIMNLAANAIRHTDKGYVLINVLLVANKQAHDTDKANIRISLEDSGLALQKRTVTTLHDGESGFSSEFRGKRSLGLDICFQLVELMNSQLCNESTASGGSSYWFDIEFPLTSQKPEQQGLDYSLLSKIRVLVIDSYELSRKITLELLQEWGIAFEATSTASDALKLINNYEQNDLSGFNLILCDDLLQDLSGIEACQKLRGVLSPYVAIVVLCSNPQLGDAESFFLSGANGFISKQFRDPFLKSVICQSYAERFTQGQDKRLITRYTISDAEPGKNSSISESEKSVLIVETNIINQQLIMNMLEKNNCRVDLASNGFEAIELFKSNLYSLIFMDCAMPDMDGFETTLILREIEKSHTDKKQTPIIAMTTNDIDGEIDRCYQVGMDELMTKPIKIAKLEMVLGRYIH